MKQLNLFDGINDKKFVEYHEQNPHLYEEFKKIALESIAMGLKNYGAKSIFEIIRWETAKRGEGEFKINNNYAPLFARLFANEYPEHRDFFRFRLSRKFAQYDPKPKPCEIVFSYDNSLVITTIAPEEDDWWTTLNVEINGAPKSFDIHYDGEGNSLSVYELRKRKSIFGIFGEELVSIHQMKLR